MLMPTALQAILDRSLSQMLQHPQHVLLPIYRRKIYEIVNSDPGIREQKIYERLSIRTAEYVLPIWQQTWPTDYLPQFMLATAKQVLTGTVSPTQAKQIAGDAWQQLEQLGSAPHTAASSHAFHAGQAAVETLFAVLGRPPFDGVLVEEYDTDADLDPWSSDPALWAVTAYAGGAWEQTSDANKRREFWEWWLTEAIPSSMVNPRN